MKVGQTLVLRAGASDGMPSFSSSQDSILHLIKHGLLVDTFKALRGGQADIVTHLAGCPVTLGAPTVCVELPVMVVG